MRGFCYALGLNKACVPAKDVAPAVCHDAVWRALEMRSDTQLIAHCPAHDKQCRWEAGQLGDKSFEAVCSPVFAEDIIAQSRALKGHEGFEHSWRGSGSHIA